MGKTVTKNENRPALAYQTRLGKMISGKIEDALLHPSCSAARGKVDLILTSPPFPLVRKKEYGNKTGENYLTWLSDLAPRLVEMLSPTGSIVIEIGNAWDPGLPTMSTLPLESLLSFKKAGKLHLCQQLVCHNPARLPGPAEWVSVRRIRLKDTYTHVWWLSKTDNPKADNRKVLTPYSKDMQKLLSKQSYNAGERPSGHKISKTGFLKSHGGAITPNALDLGLDDERVPSAMLKMAATEWDANYRQYCVDQGLKPHPARMQQKLVSFFTEFLTEPGDLVMDPFAGSNTTGAVAEAHGRRWLSVEADPGYVQGSQGRFVSLSQKKVA